MLSLAIRADLSVGLSDWPPLGRHRCKYDPAVSEETNLTGSQHVTTGADAEKNFLVVDNKTETSTIESTFDRLIERKDIAIVLINQHASRPFPRIRAEYYSPLTI